MREEGREHRTAAHYPRSLTPPPRGEEAPHRPSHPSASRSRLSRLEGQTAASRARLQASARCHQRASSPLPACAPPPPSSLPIHPASLPTSPPTPLAACWGSPQVQRERQPPPSVGERREEQSRGGEGMEGERKEGERPPHEQAARALAARCLQRHVRALLRRQLRASLVVVGQPLPPAPPDWADGTIRGTRNHLQKLGGWACVEEPLRLQAPLSARSEVLKDYSFTPRTNSGRYTHVQPRTDSGLVRQRSPSPTNGKPKQSLTLACAHVGSQTGSHAPRSLSMTHV